MSKALEDCMKFNKAIAQNKLSIYTWGNVSVKDGTKNIRIKPSGVPFQTLTKKDVSLVDIKSGNLLSGKRQSVDTLIHLEIYKAFPETKCVIHTHSTFLTSFAQAKKEVPILGTTHADYFNHSIPVANQVQLDETHIMETLVGQSVVDVAKQHFDVGTETMAVLIPCHGSIIWTENPSRIIEYAIVLEEIAKLAYLTLTLVPNTQPNEQDLGVFKFHYLRKNGEKKYYGQNIR